MADTAYGSDENHRIAEATMSEYDRLTGVKNLRGRGRKAVRFCAKMKAAVGHAGPSKGAGCKFEPERAFL